MSKSELEAHVLLEFVEDFKQQPNFRRGPITKAEMEWAKTIKIDRARANGRGLREPVERQAASDLRDERIDAYCDYYALDAERFRRALAGRDGSINRLKSRRPNGDA
jgi:hypothetical protein